MFYQNIELMTLSLDTAEVFSTGNEPLEVLGFKNEKDLEEALVLLMQPTEETSLVA